VAKIWLID